jgi:hypothetical protein
MTASYARYFIALGLIVGSAGEALAQAPASQATCFDVLMPPSDSQPAGAILLNRCSGQTWILVRTYQPHARGIPAYRWSPVASDAANPKPPAPAPATVTGDKCFIFQGRRFCE